jgi:hypothetical protein
MEDRASVRVRTLVTPMARSRPVRQRERTRADIHDGPKQCSNQRPDTLMQDRSPPARRNHLQRTAGPYVGVNRYRSFAAGPDAKSALARKPT